MKQSRRQVIKIFLYSLLVCLLSYLVFCFVIAYEDIKGEGGYDLPQDYFLLPFGFAWLIIEDSFKTGNFSLLYATLESCLLTALFLTLWSRFDKTNKARRILLASFSLFVFLPGFPFLLLLHIGHINWKRDYIPAFLPGVFNYMGFMMIVLFRRNPRLKIPDKNEL
ncbi:MAG: hypothetical protein ACHQRM_05600 [Bacteroidia bacterium]